MKNQQNQTETNENVFRKLEQEELFLADNSWDGGFLQSSFWKNFQKALGKEVILIDKRAEGFWGLALKHQLPLVKGYWFFPRGPIFSRENQKEAAKVFLELAKKMKQESCLGWVRIEPQDEKDLAEIKKIVGTVRGIQLKKAPKDHEPAQTLFLGLGKSKEDLLSKMKPKTRYNIRLAEKRGVKVRKSRKNQDVARFYALIKQTCQRNKIVPFSFEHYKKMLETIDQKHLELFLAEFGGEIIGGILVSFFGRTAIYLHGATADLHRNVMAMYLLQWEAIKEAQKRGCEKYDFNGINPEDKNSSNYKKSWEALRGSNKGLILARELFLFLVVGILF